MTILETYQDIKSKHPDAIVFMRLGNFYEAFNEDAEIVAEATGLTLHTIGAREVKMAGAQSGAIDSYVARLVKKGHRVAMAERKE